ncbi:50S ribosomal protein L30 [archaeon]|jgi:large subunit ribosomal protein L30e|nr:50S ribosomal protein L30 [archaeon]MBT6697467.1 50S ribosomal protein L30 [archaeon]
MAAKETKTIEQIKTLLTEEKAIIGKNEVLRAIKSGSANKVFLAKNAPEDLKADLAYYNKINPIEIVNLEIDNEELGVLCKKNFFIAVIACSA